MGFLTSPLLPVKIETKIFEKVIIYCSAEKCYLKFDTEKWEFVPAEKEDEWQEIRPDGTTWIVKLVDVFPRMEAILKDIFQDKKVPVRINELHIWNWFRLPELFAREQVHVKKLQLMFCSHRYQKKFLLAFQKPGLSHLTVASYFSDSNFLDDLKLMEVDYLLLMTQTMDDRSKFTGFRAKRWDVSEDWHQGVEHREPLILEFVGKMLSEKPDVLSKYETNYVREFDMQSVVELVQNKYPNAQLCDDGRRLLTIKLEDREVNVYHARRYKFRTFPYRCGVRMEALGTAKPAEKMSSLERFCLRKYDEFCIYLVKTVLRMKLDDRFPNISIDPFYNLMDYLLRIPVLVAGNFVMIPLLILAFFCLPNIVALGFLVFWIVFNSIGLFNCIANNRKHKDPYLFECY